MTSDSIAIPSCEYDTIIVKNGSYTVIFDEDDFGIRHFQPCNVITEEISHRFIKSRTLLFFRYPSYLNEEYFSYS